MKIKVEDPAYHKGDIYGFTLEFNLWLSKELGCRVKESEEFIKKFGKGWTLNFGWDKGRRIKKPRFTEPGIDHRYKELRWVIEVPRFKFDSPSGKSYVPKLKQYLEGIVAILTREKIDASKIQKAMPALFKRLASTPLGSSPDALGRSRPGLLEYDPHPYTFGTEDDPYGIEAESAASTQPATKSKTPAKFVKRKLPKWKIPKKLLALVEEDGMWESERFGPVLLTVMSGTSYRSRKIPLAWQIEFEPEDRQFAPANAKIAASGFQPDGDGWA